MNLAVLIRLQNKIKCTCDSLPSQQKMVNSEMELEAQTIPQKLVKGSFFNMWRGADPRGVQDSSSLVGLRVSLLGKTKSEVVNSFCLGFFFFLAHWLGFFPPFKTALLSL